MTRYISTRGFGMDSSQNEAAIPQTFEEVLLAGLAPDGGLFVPESWPALDIKALAGSPDLSYTSIAAQVMLPFIGNSIPHADFQRILKETYEGSAFEHACVTPLRQLSSTIWSMEHFHGPTLAFKDVALQLLGRLFDYVLEKKGQRITIVGATSGDTGSAAIEACKNCKNVDIFILHPKGRVSEVQRRQMTTVQSDNVYNIAVEGTFDDCQNIVKAMFADDGFRSTVQLSAINSINWARIMAQVVYYVSTAVAMGAPEREVSFSVPTGNFGNVFAGYVAKQMGLPIRRLIISTNRNDILTRFFETGEMKLDGVNASLSPSMDIQISSNFERYLFDLLGRDPEAVTALMREFKETGRFALSAEQMDAAREEFSAYRCDDTQTLAVIKDCYDETGIVIDPHTAVGLHGARSTKDDPSVPIINLACAHPAKFPDAVEKAIGKRPPLPERMTDLLEREEYYTPMENDLATIQGYVKSKTRVKV